MGGFYGSVQVRTTDRAAVKAAAEAVAREKSIRCLIGPEINGWVGIYPEGNGQDDSVGAAVAKQLACDVLHLLVHDDDVLAYWLWRDHTLVDSYWSKPGILGEENLAEEESRRGDPERFRAIIGDKADRIADLLDRDTEYTFESERLAKLTKLLGISNCVTAYDYLVSDERAGIKGWRKFEKIPPDPATPATAAAKHKAPSRRSVREKLKKSGLLLYSQEWNEFTLLLHGFPVGDGFVLGWVNPRQKTAELCQLVPPLYKPDPLLFDPDKANAHTQGNFAVVDSGNVLRVMDKSSSPWRLIATIPQIDQVGFAAISPRGEYIAHLNQLKIIVRSLPAGDQMFEVARVRSSRIAFHPTEKWLAVTGDELGLISFDGEARVRRILVGGSRSFVIANIRGIEEPGCVGFSRDGRLFWCGTNVGLRIYEWESLRSGSSHKARWQLRLQDKLPSFWAKQVTAIAEEADGTGIVFGTFAGKLARFDLQTGELHKLVDLPTGGQVEALLFSADGTALAVSSDESTQKGPRSMPKHTRAWEIWDYRKLRESGTLIGRAEKPEPPVDDLSQWRRASARGGRRMPRQRPL